MTVRIIFLNRYFSPDYSATSQLLTDLTEALAGTKWDVTVICSRQLYDNPAARLPHVEHVNNVLVRRVWTTTFGRYSTVGRGMDYVTFYAAAACAVLRWGRRGDIVVAKTDPPLLGVVIGPIGKLVGAKTVNWLQDLFPEVAAVSGVRIARGILGKVIRAARDLSLRSSRLNVVVGERMAAYLESHTPGIARPEVVHNWADATAVWPVPPQANYLRTQWGLGAKFVVGYSGNMGRVHEFGTVLDAAELLHGLSHVVFVFIGGGRYREWIEAEAARRRLHNLQFQPYQPRQRLAYSLSVPDVHLISLRSTVEGFVVPSKFYGVAAAARPTVFVGDADGEIARIIRATDCGRVVPEGDAQALAEAIRGLSHNQALCRRQGANARLAFEQRFDRSIAVKKWERLLAGLASAK